MHKNPRIMMAKVVTNNRKGQQSSASELTNIYQLNSSWFSTREGQCYLVHSGRL